MEDYAARAYQIILDQQSILPDRVKQMMPYMMKGNWLVNYANIEGIHRVLQGMSRRATFDSKMDEAVHELKIHFQEFENEFTEFFPELKAFSRQWLEGFAGTEK